MFCLFFTIFLTFAIVFLVRYLTLNAPSWKYEMLTNEDKQLVLKRRKQSKILCIIFFVAFALIILGVAFLPTNSTTTTEEYLLSTIPESEVYIKYTSSSNSFIIYYENELHTVECNNLKIFDSDSSEKKIVKETTVYTTTILNGNWI